MDHKHNDPYCWQCHLEGVNFGCSSCKRSFHKECEKRKAKDGGSWVCSVCLKVKNAKKTRSAVIKNMSLSQLSKLLVHAIHRMKAKVDVKNFLFYKKSNILNVCRPMFVEDLEKMTKDRRYTSTTSFIADVKWIHHNSVIHKGPHSKTTQTAKQIVDVLIRECTEIDDCHQCYEKATNPKSKPKAFLEVCDQPHILLWAKHNDKPFWPVKAFHHYNGMVVCKCFGSHNKLNIPVSSCFLYSTTSPNSSVDHKYEKQYTIACQEIALHIKNVKDKFEIFLPAEPNTRYSPIIHKTQLQCMKRDIADKQMGVGVSNSTASTPDIDKNLPKSRNPKKRKIKPTLNDAAKKNIKISDVKVDKLKEKSEECLEQINKSFVETQQKVLATTKISLTEIAENVAAEVKRNIAYKIMHVLHNMENTDIELKSKIDDLFQRINAMSQK